MTRRDLLERKMDARTSRDSLVKKGAEWSVSSEMTQEFLSEMEQHYEQNSDYLENSVYYKSAIHQSFRSIYDV